MIKKLLLGTVVIAATSATAFAADLPSRRAPPVYVPPPLPVFTWTGGYFGINAGYAFDNRSDFSLRGNQPRSAGLIAAGNVSPFSQRKSNGFTGGGQIGYNYELGGLGSFGGFGGLGQGGIVAGVEADAAYTDLSRTYALGGVGGFGTTYHARTEFVGTARGRLGIAFDTLMVYGTGGFAYGGVRNDVQVASFNGLSRGGSDRIRTGYAYGGGIEYALPTTSFVNVFHSGAVTLKAEYIHYDLGTTATAITGRNGGFTSRLRTDGNLARVGLNYKMNFFNPAPVVARY